MAEERNPDVVISSYPEGEAGDAEAKDRGLFDFMGKKNEKVEEEVLVTGVEKVHIEETEKPVEEEKKHGLLHKLHRSHSSSSSSSSDEEGEGEGEKKEKKKKGLKEKIKEKLHGEEEKMEVKPEVVLVAEEDDTTIVVEKVEAHPEEEKKGFLDKIKEKLPGQNKKPTEEGATATAHPPPPPPAAVECGEHHAKEPEGEKKGFLEKIKEKLPGFHKNGGDESEKTAAGH